MAINIDEKDLSKFILIGDRVLLKPKNPASKTKSGYKIEFNNEEHIALPHVAILMLIRDEGMFD